MELFHPTINWFFGPTFQELFSVLECFWASIMVLGCWDLKVDVVSQKQNGTFLGCVS